jgi:purine-binding chemotaxis protein CheW
MATALTLHNETGEAQRTDSRLGKYLTFHLGQEEYGVQVLQVREIMGLQDITAVPQTPHHVRGVINLRGKVIPVLCLRAKFGLPETEYTTRTCIIVVFIKQRTGGMQVGIIVDDVSEVLNIVANEIEDTPDFGEGAGTPYILGMAKIKGKVKILLDIDQVVSPQEMLVAQELAS